MGIQSTMTISRDDAIKRIMEVSFLIFQGKYKELEDVSSEYDYDIQDFISREEQTVLSILGSGVVMANWTNGMLEDKMDEPYYRFSMFDNYSIEDLVRRK